jgi:outer membrane protein OmpA-like peptidoglycan-associated protein
MKTDRHVTGSSVAISILLLSLSACAAYQSSAAKMAQVDSAPLPQLGERVRLEGVRFKPDSAKMRADSKPVLDAAAQLLKSEPDKKLYVDAYCDQLGIKKADRRLAKRRAESVKSSLEARGIASDRMIARGFASEHSGSRVHSSQVFCGNSKVELIPFANAPNSTNFASSLSPTSELD